MSHERRWVKCQLFHKNNNYLHHRKRKVRLHMSEYDVKNWYLHCTSQENCQTSGYTEKFNVIITGVFHYTWWDPLKWRHNERDGVSNHRRFDCLPNRLFRHRSKKTSKFHVTSLCEGNPPATVGFRSKRVNNVENSSIWWRHHASNDFSWGWNVTVCV